MNLDELKKSNMIIYDAIGGSHAYGTSTPNSDKDIRGLFMYPKDAYLGLEEPAQQISDTKQDITYYSLKRYFELAKTSNPNIIEMLWLPKDCVNFISPIMQKLIENRDMFISKKAYFTHSSYAHSQIGKAKGQNKMVNHPELAIKPKKEDFCWIIPDFSMDTEFLKLKSCEIDTTLMPCRPIPFKEYCKANNNFDLKFFHCAALEHVSNTYRLYFYGDKSKGIFRGDDMLTCESIPFEDEYDKFSGLLIYNQNEFEKALNEHRKYNEWIENRNSSRWIDQEKGLVEYDCKNIMHCFRLLISGEHILNYGLPLVRFEGEQKEYLMKIRRGEFSYNELMVEVENRMAKLEELYKTSSIPHSIDISKIEKLYRELTA